MRGVGGVEDGGTALAQLRGEAVVDIVRRAEPDAAVVVIAVVPVEEVAAVGPRVLDVHEAVGEVGAVFECLEGGSEKGLSLDTCGREWVLVTPRSASSSATGLEVIELPRSAWIVSWPGWMPWRSQVSWMSFSASAALSSCATIQPTT